MSLVGRGPVQQFEIGEEILFALDEGSVLEIGDDTMLLTPLPSWVIGDIVAMQSENGMVRYRVGFAWAGSKMFVSVAEASIHGVV